VRVQKFVHNLFAFNRTRTTLTLIKRDTTRGIWAKCDNIILIDIAVKILNTMQGIISSICITTLRPHNSRRSHRNGIFTIQLDSNNNSPSSIFERTLHRSENYCKVYCFISNCYMIIVSQQTEFFEGSSDPWENLQYFITIIVGNIPTNSFIHIEVKINTLSQI